MKFTMEATILEFNCYNDLVKDVIAKEIPKNREFGISKKQAQQLTQKYADSLEKIKSEKEIDFEDKMSSVTIEFTEDKIAISGDYREEYMLDTLKLMQSMTPTVVKVFAKVIGIMDVISDNKNKIKKAVIAFANKYFNFN